MICGLEEEEGTLSGRIVSIEDYFTYPDPFPEKGILIIDKRKAGRIKDPYQYGKLLIGNTGDIYISGLKNEYEFPGKKEIFIPKTIEGGTVTEISGTDSFSRNIKKVILPEGVNCIGSSEFKGCSVLEEIVLPDSIKKIRAHCFESCRQLTKIRLPEGIAEIGEFTFAYCRNLKKVYIPDSVKYISDTAFMGCDPVIFCSPGSFAAKYAENKRISYMKAEYYSRIDLSDHPEKAGIADTSENGESVNQPAGYSMLEISLPQNERRKTATVRGSAEKSPAKREEKGKTHVEVLNDTFAGFGLQVLQVGDNMTKSSSGEEVMTFYVELKSLPDVVSSGLLNLKVNVYDTVDRLLSMGYANLAMENFTGYDTVEVQVKIPPMRGRMVKARVYLTKA